MTGNDPSAVARDVRTLLEAGRLGALTDGQLLDRFARRRDEAEAAFAALVGRYGPMVWGACRRILDDPNDAADAFQATFLVLVRKAGSVRVDDSLGRWLHGVARKVAGRARATAARRRSRGRPGVESVAAPAPAPGRAEMLAELDAEIGRLPGRYRGAVVLCDLGGMSHEEAALQLGCAVGTVGSRLSRGRARLRDRMTRRGLAPSSGVLPAASPMDAPPMALMESTSRAALRLVAGDVVSASANVAALSKEMVLAMLTTRLKLAAAFALLATAGLTALSYAAPAPAAPAPPGRQGAPAARPAGPGRRAPGDAEAEASGPGVAIRGRVDGPDGKPLAGAKLGSPILVIREGVVTTGPDGGFTITAEEIPRGDFALRVDAPGLTSKMFTIKTAPSPPTTPPIDPSEPAPPPHVMGPTGEIGPALDMERGNVVTGRIVRGGKPVPDAAVGLWRETSGFDALLGLPPVVKADGDGRFRLPQTPDHSRCWIYVPTGSLGRAGSVRPRLVRTPGEESSTDLGDIAVEPGRTVSGRVAFADGKPWPADAEVQASADHADGVSRSKPNQAGEFTLVGLPEGQVSIFAYFPDGRSYAPAGYHVSARNKCLDPLNPWRLVGRVDRDVTGLTILFEPGEQPPPSLAPDILEAFEEARAGPVAGVPPGPR